MDLLMLMFLIVYCVLFIHMVVDLYFQGVDKSWNAITQLYEKDIENGIAGVIVNFSFLLFCKGRTL